MSYRLDRAASVRFTIRRASRGRRVGRKCRAQTRRNRAARRCTRFVKVKGGFTRRRAAGADSFRFNGRLRGKALRVGRYRMIATPLDDGHTGNPARRAFRIAPSSARG